MDAWCTAQHCLGLKAPKDKHCYRDTLSLQLAFSEQFLVTGDTALICDSLDSIMPHGGEDVGWETHLVQWLGSPLGEALLVIWQLLYSWPCLGCWRAKQPENFENLINLLQRDRCMSDWLLGVKDKGVSDQSYVMSYRLVPSG